jgi:hypothetical protein
MTGGFMRRLNTDQLRVTILQCSRNQFGEEFVSALRADFAEHGAEVLERVRKESPAQYLRVCATVVPRECQLKTSLSMR